MTTRNKRKLATLDKENFEEHLSSRFAQNSNVPRSQEDYITQVSEEIEGRVTKKLSQEFSRTENRILGALARLDDFFMNPLTQGHSGTAPETSRNVCSISQGTNEDDSQSNPHPEAGLSNNQMTQNSGPEDGHDRNGIWFSLSFLFFRSIALLLSRVLFQLSGQVLDIFVPSRQTIAKYGIRLLLMFSPKNVLVLETDLLGHNVLYTTIKTIS